ITGVVPLVNSAFRVFIDMLVVATLNVYFLLDGGRAVNWLRRNTPLGQRERLTFLIQTVDRTVGGYVRGQLILATIAGLLTIIAIFAVLAGGQLFGLAGIIFSAPIAGILQSLLVAFWRNWKVTHADQFPTEVVASPLPPSITAPSATLVVEALHIEETFVQGQ